MDGTDLLLGITAIYDHIRSHTQRRTSEQSGQITPKKYPTITELQNDRRRLELSDRQGYQSNDCQSNSARNMDVTNRNVAPGYQAIDMDSHEIIPPPLYPSFEQSSLGVPHMNGAQDMYADVLPFDNLNVGELWNWMLGIDSDDVMVRGYQSPMDSMGDGLN